LICPINNEIELSVGFYLQFVIEKMSSIYLPLTDQQLSAMHG